MELDLIAISIIMLFTAASFVFVYIKMRSSCKHVVLDSSNNHGIANVFVEIYDELGKMMVNEVTDRRGEFFAKVVTGDYIVKINKDGYSFKGIRGHRECNSVAQKNRLIIARPEKLAILMLKDA